MLGWRLGISAILVPLLFALFWLDHRLGETAPILLGLCLLLTCRGTYELKIMLTKRTMEPNWPVPAIAACTILLAGWGPHFGFIEGSPFTALAFICIATALGIMAVFLNKAFRFEEPGNNMESLGAELMILVYLGFLFAVTTQLRWVIHPDLGYLAIGSMVVTAKGGDIGAYFLGRFFGNRKLAPKLSPGKTIVGAYGAILGGATCSLLWFWIATPLLTAENSMGNILFILLYGVLVALAGLLGDLCESLIKRDVEQKDSASLMPGFGGLLDLMDSILFAGPVALLLWNLLPLLK